MSFNEVNQSTAELTQIAGSTLTSVYADAPIGAISAYGGDTAPTGWLICDGSAISRTTYADLYAVIGTKFGAGDGSTTFNLPDGSISAAVYPVEDVGEYIIKAVQTSVPADFETALALKQDITDNTLETTDKTIPGAINEVNTGLSGKQANISHISYSGTTSAGGNINIPTTLISSGSRILSVTVMSGVEYGGIATHFYQPSASQHLVHVTDNTGNILASTTVSLAIYYLDASDIK